MFYVGEHYPTDLPKVGEKTQAGLHLEATVVGYQFGDRAPCGGYTTHEIWWEDGEGWVMNHPTDPLRDPIPAPSGARISLVLHY